MFLNWSICERGIATKKHRDMMACTTHDTYTRQRLEVIAGSYRLSHCA